MSDSKNNSDKVQCDHCKRYVNKEDIAMLLNDKDPICYECDAYLQQLYMEQEEQQYVEVTKEMASDAGYPEMEGQIIQW